LGGLHRNRLLSFNNNGIMEAVEAAEVVVAAGVVVQ
jgi:hypothetical protein